MPFLKLNNSWSDLSKYYNQPFDNKPKIPAIRYVGFDDGLIRGGIINTTLASVQDTLRIGKFIASGKGVLFVIKQVGLQLSSPLLEQLPPSNPLPTLGQGRVQNIVNTVTNFINSKSPNQIYNLGLNTLAQIPVNAFGQHIIRQGKLPVFGGGYLSGVNVNTDNSSAFKGYNYAYIATQNNLNSKPTDNQYTSNYQGTLGEQVTNISTSGKTQAEANANFDKIKQNLIKQGKIPVDLNRTVNLADLTITSSNKLSYKNAPNRLLQYLQKIQLKSSNTGNKLSSLITNPIELSSYNGGPESTYGIGKTFINTYPDQRTNISVNLSDPKISLLNGFEPDSYSELDKKSSILSPIFQRQNKTYIPITDDFYIDDPSPSNNNIENRIGVSKIGKKGNVVRSVDAINTISIMDGNTFYKYSGTGINKNIGNSDYSSDNQFGNSSLFTYSKNTSGKVQAGNFGRDIIKFRIEFINNNKINETEILAFRAYIDDFTDGMTSKWNTFNYMGRGEDFYVYNGFTRDISVSFTLYAHSPEEMRPIYQKLNYLMSTFTPDYSSKLKMRGNIAKLTVGDYLYQQPGIFTDIKLSGMLDTHWEIAMSDPEGGADSSQYEVPKHIKVSLTFKPIHNFLPRRAYKNTLVNSPFITRNDKQNKYLLADLGSDGKSKTFTVPQSKQEEEAQFQEGMRQFQQGVDMGILDRRRDV